MLVLEYPSTLKRQKILGSGWELAAPVRHAFDLPAQKIGSAAPDFNPQHLPMDKGQRPSFSCLPFHLPDAWQLVPDCGVARGAPVLAQAPGPKPKKLSMIQVEARLPAKSIPTVFSCRGQGCVESKQACL
jgi:hypothetical protein